MNPIREALGLYRSMVRSGEQESTLSVAAFDRALAELERLVPNAGVNDVEEVPEAEVEPDPTAMVDDIAATLNRYCAENGSDTPDFILAEYLKRCLDNYDATLQAREKWYGREMKMQGDQTPADFPGGGPA